MFRSNTTNYYSYLCNILSFLIEAMRYCVFDIETDNLYAEVSKLHCLAYYSFDTENDTIASGVLTDYDAIKNFLETQEKQEYLLLDTIS